MKDEPYVHEEAHPPIHRRVPRPRRSAVPRAARRPCQRVQAGPRSGSNGPGDRSDAQNAAYRAIASKLGCSHETLRAWCNQASRDAGERDGSTSAEKARIKELERENRELRTVNEVLKKTSAYFAMAELDRPFRK